MSGYRFPIVPRYAEIDQQGVVFNGHYLTWFDEAATGLFDHLGVSFTELARAGIDMQVVHCDIDFMSAVRWRDRVSVEVACEHLGTTSFTLRFSVVTDETSRDRPAVRGRTVYVVVSDQDWTKRPIPEEMRGPLHSVLDASDG